MSKRGIWCHYSHQNSFGVSWHRLLQASPAHWKEASSLLQALLSFVLGRRCKEANNNLPTGAIAQPREDKCFEIPEAAPLLSDSIRDHKDDVKSQQNSLRHSPADSEAARLMSVGRMVVFPTLLRDF